MTLNPQPVDFMEKWNSLQETLKKLIKLEHVSRAAWNKCFNDIYQLCTAVPEPFADELYDSTMLFLEKHLLELQGIILHGGNANILQNYYTYWQKYSNGAKYLHSLYQYLNNQHIKKKKPFYDDAIFENLTPYSIERLEVEKLCLDLWKQIIIIPLKEEMSELLLDEYDKQGHNKSTAISLDMIASIIYSLVVVQEFRTKYPLGLYQICFEQPYLKRRMEHSKSYAARLLQECTVSKYLVKVLETLEYEGIKAKKYLHSSTYYKVHKLCHQNMVVDHIEFLLLESESIIKEERQNDMQNIYLLLRDIKDGMDSLVNIFREHVQQCGIRILEILEQEQEQEQIYIHFVEELSAVYNKYKTMVIDVFHNDPCFNSAMDKAFEVVINHQFVKDQPSKSPEYLSLYCDYLLKKTTKKSMKKDIIDQKLTQSITLFKYFDDKDIFQRFYQRHLARRLILQQSQSLDVEEEIIQKLKDICGFEYIRTFQKMFVDINVSKELITKFNDEFLTTKDKLNINFSVKVLQTKAWPIGSSPVSFRLPKQLISCMQYFEEYYNSKFNERKLTWLHHHCHGELKLNYLPKVYMVSMQTIHMAILLLFEDNSTLKNSEIHELLLSTNDQFLQKHIKSLVECKLLLTDGDNVSLNMEYFNKRTKLHISLALQKDTPQEIRQTINNSVELDHTIYLQATIIRIMKTRKLLGHNKLVNEVLTQSISFIPTITLIKKCIEILIDKEYLERTPNSSNMYSYIA